MYQQLQRACTAIVLLIKPFRLLFGDALVAVAVVVFYSNSGLTRRR